MTENWPVADLDPVRRLRVLAAAARFPVYVSEVVLPAPVERVWAAAADLERALPSFISTVRSARITQAEGDRLELLATGTLGQRARFDVVLRPGWCLMRSRFVLGAMAAVPEAGGTRFAALGGFRLPGARLAAPLLTVLGDRSMRAFAEHLELHAHP
jgi:hypothetical protein